MSNWGERFATVSSFISYGRGLGVETNQNELEHYEKTGAMLPVVRVVYPDGYVTQQYQSLWNGDMDWDGVAQWPALPAV